MRLNKERPSSTSQQKKSPPAKRSFEDTRSVAIPAKNLDIPYAIEKDEFIAPISELLSSICACKSRVTITTARLATV